MYSSKRKTARLPLDNNLLPINMEIPKPYFKSKEKSFEKQNAELQLYKKPQSILISPSNKARSGTISKGQATPGNNTVRQPISIRTKHIKNNSFTSNNALSRVRNIGSKFDETLRIIDNTHNKLLL